MPTMNYNPQLGDIILVWGKGFVPSALRFVISKIWGIKDPATHAEVAVNKLFDISAEVNGVIYKKREKTFNDAKKIKVIRHKKMTEERQKLIVERSTQYVGKGYDYYNHIRWYLLFLCITSPIIYFISDPIRKWLRRESKKRWHCSELTAQLYEDVGIETGFVETNFVPPHYFYQLAEASDIWQIIFEEEK